MCLRRSENQGAPVSEHQKSLWNKKNGNFNNNDVFKL
jgi:hypothetical protein